MSARTKTKAADVLAAFRLMLPSPSWSRWLAFVKAWAALPMDDHELAIYRACTGRTNPPAERARRVVALIGRRGGKTRVIAWLGSYLAAFIDYRAVLAPGEVGVVAVMAPSKAQAGICRRYLEGFFDAEPALQRMIVRRTADALDIQGQGGTLIRVLVISASYKLSRGHTLVAFIGDESAFWESESSSANPDIEIFRSILPALATTGGPAILISTPYAPQGLVYDLHDKHWGRDGDTLVWRADSLTMNPLLDAKLIEQAYKDDPESASAEYGAHFRSDLRSLFAIEALQACIVAGRRELLPQAGIVYTAFADSSGGSQDSFTLAIAHKNQDGLVVIDLAREWVPPFDPQVVVREIVALLRRYYCSSLIGDRYAGEWVASAFAAHGTTYQASEQNRSEIYLECLPFINASQVQLPENARMLAQFGGLQRRTGSSGRDTIDHRPGAKDDLANSVAGAVVFAAHGTGKLVVPADFTSCNRLASGMPSLGGGTCYLFGGHALPPQDVCCRPCVGNQFVRAARKAHRERTGEAVDVRVFFREFVELPEPLATRIAVRLANEWAEGMGI